MHFFDYLPVEDWKILDRKDFHFFNTDETILRALCVEIGVMNTISTDSSIFSLGGSINPTIPKKT